MTKAAMTRLMKSEFFHTTCEVVMAWDYYLHEGDRQAADEMMYKWQMAKLALEHITGEIYGFSRDGETVRIVNEADCNDVLFSAASIVTPEHTKGI